MGLENSYQLLWQESGILQLRQYFRIFLWYPINIHGERLSLIPLYLYQLFFLEIFLICFRYNQVKIKLRYNQKADLSYNRHPQYAHL